MIADLATLSNTTIAVLLRVQRLSPARSCALP